MSRAYRIRIRETLRTVIRAEDEVHSALELLPVLPPEAMRQLLAEELEREGLAEQDGQWVLDCEGVRITVDLETGRVTAKSQVAQELELERQVDRQIVRETEREREVARKQTQQELQQVLANEAAQRQQELQGAATDALEAALRDHRGRIDRAVNRATAAALKQKAKQLGEVKQISEDGEGSLTIVVEV